MSTTSNARRSPRLAAAVTIVALVLLPVAAGNVAASIGDGPLNAAAKAAQTHV
jgi:hypothetical protein